MSDAALPAGTQPRGANPEDLLTAHAQGTTFSTPVATEAVAPLGGASELVPAPEAVAAEAGLLPPPMRETLLAYPLAITNIPAARTEVALPYGRRHMDLSRVRAVRLGIALSSPAMPAGAVFEATWFDFNSSTYRPLGVAGVGGPAIGGTSANGNYLSPWVNLHADAQFDPALVILTTRGGDGVADPVIVSATLEYRPYAVA